MRSGFKSLCEYHTFENGVTGNTRDFDSLVLSSNLGSRATHFSIVYMLATVAGKLVDNLTVIK